MTAHAAAAIDTLALTLAYPGSRAARQRVGWAADRGADYAYESGLSCAGRLSAVL